MRRNVSKKSGGFRGGWIAAFVLLTNISVSQQRAALTGRVVDAESHRPLAGASVLIPEIDAGTSSAEDGMFEFRGMREGDYVIQVRYVGYTTAIRHVHASEAPSPLEIALEPTVLPGQTIVITATRGRERETPATFSTLSADELIRRYTTQDIPQLLSELPSVTWYSENGNGIGYNYLNIRGFDQRRISVMVNGIPQNDPEDHNVYWLDFPDLAASLEDIQVQRGGGSAFYGPPAIGGSVNLVTSTFSRSPSVSVSGGYGTFNTRKYSAAINSGLVDNRYLFFGRLASITSDGYRKRSWTNFSSYFLGAVRFDETMTTQLNFYGGPVADHLAYYGISKANAYSSDEERRRENPIQRSEEIENFSQPHFELFHEWRAGAHLTVNNTIFIVTGEGYFDYDGAWAPFSYYRLTPQNGFPAAGDPDTLYSPNALIRAFVDNRQIGWLPRVQWQHADGELTAGAELRVHRSLHWGALQWGERLPAGVTPEYHYYEYRGGKDIFSLHAQELYHPRPDMTAMFSLQYVYNRYRLFEEKYIGTDFAVPYHFLNPKIGLNLNLTNAYHLYAQLSRTTREPRLKNLYDAAEASTPASWGSVTPQFESPGGTSYDFSRPLVKPERLTNLEFGFGYRSDWLHWLVNAYWMDFQDEIVKNGNVDRFGQPITGNAERTRHAGVELSGRAEIAPGLAFDGNMTWSRNRLVRYTMHTGGGPVSLDGNAIAGFPDILGNLRVTYSTERAAIGVSAQHVGDFFTDNLQDPDDRAVDPGRRVDARTVLNTWLSLTVPLAWSRSSVEFQVQVNNLLNLRYASHGEADQFFPAATRNAFASMRVNM